MIRHLEFTNYRSHEDTSFDLEPMTVFIGPVAGGKSNVFRGLTLLQNAMIRAPKELFGSGPYDIWAQRFRGSPNAPIAFKVRLDQLGTNFEGEEAIYSLQISEGPGGVFIAEERLDRCRATSRLPGETVFRRTFKRDYVGEFGHIDPTDRAIVGTCRFMQDNASEKIRFAAAVGYQLSHYGYFHLEASELARTSSVYDHPERIGYNGRDLPGALSSFKEKTETEATFVSILEQMRELLPDLEDILLVPVGPDQLGIGFKHAGFDGHITPREASDGTLFTLGLLAIVHQPALPVVLALEEPETGLHPSRLQWLVDKLWDLAHGRIADRRVQVLISTHSPYFLDRFQNAPEVIRVVQRRNGRTRVASLPEVAHEIGMSDEELRSDSLGRQWYAGIFEEVA